MSRNLKKISIEKAKDIIQDKEVLKILNKSEEPIYELSYQISSKVDPLVALEISLRRCKRVGVFKS